MENNMLEPAVAQEEQQSGEGNQKDSKSVSGSLKDESNTQTMGTITSKSGEQTAGETQSRSSKSNSQMTGTDINMPEHITGYVEANGVTSQNKYSITDRQPGSSESNREVTELNSVNCDVIANTVNENIGETNDGENEGDAEGAFINETVKIYNNGREDSVDVAMLDRMQSDPVYQKNATSLLQLCSYGSESECEEISENQNEKAVESETQNEKEERSHTSGLPDSNVGGSQSTSVSQSSYRKPPVEVVSDVTDSEDSDDDSSGSLETTSSSDESDDVVVVVKKDAPKQKPKESPSSEIPKTKGELSLEDLPPIEDLYITVPDSECVEIGRVMNIVESLVVVQALKGCPALDLDSVLFLDKGKRALGQVFDVFGPVGEPCYCVRFNSNEHAKEKGIEKGMSVYFAPRTKHANFVFVKDLMKMKGSDASWEDNNEPPEKYLEFSDDEEERKVRRDKAEAKHQSESDKTQRPKKRAFRRVQLGQQQQQQQQDNQRSHFSNSYQGNPWSSQNSGRPCTPSGPPPSPFQPGLQPLVRPPSFSTPPPFPSSNNIDNRAQPPRINPWLVPLPAQNFAFPPAQQQFPPGPAGSYAQHAQNFVPSNTSFPAANPNFASPDRIFSARNPNFASPNANFAPSDADFPPLSFGPFGPITPNSRHPTFSQPPPGW